MAERVQKQIEEKGGAGIKVYFTTSHIPIHPEREKNTVSLLSQE